MTDQHPGQEGQDTGACDMSVTTMVDETNRDTVRSAIASMAEVTGAMGWLQVLAAPRLFARLERVPPLSFLLRQIDVFLAYARTGAYDTEPTFEPVPLGERVERTLCLRALLEGWTSRELPAKITDAARAVLYAEGLLPPGGWDCLPDPEQPIDELLVWPDMVKDKIENAGGGKLSPASPWTTGDANNQEREHDSQVTQAAQPREPFSQRRT